jgi:hypothetical protein
MTASDMLSYVACYITFDGGSMEYNKPGILFKFIENSIEKSRNNLLQGTDITASQADILTF